MPNIFVEPAPKPWLDRTPILGYVLKFADGDRMDTKRYRTQADAAKAAWGFGHHPLVARVPGADKGNPDHWQSP